MTNTDTRLHALTRMMDDGQKQRLIEAARAILMDDNANQNKGENVYAANKHP